MTVSKSTVKKRRFRRKAVLLVKDGRAYVHTHVVVFMDWCFRAFVHGECFPRHMAGLRDRSGCRVVWFMLGVSILLSDSSRVSFRSRVSDVTQYTRYRRKLN
jgi:hypothetical protein